MKWNLLAVLMMALMMACATVGSGGAQYAGSAAGASMVMNSQASVELARAQAEATKKMADAAAAVAATGRPVSMHLSPGTADIQSGYSYGYGGYGMSPYGQYGYGDYAYSVSPQLMAAEMASLGYLPGSLPTLGSMYQPGYVEQGGQLTLGTCPKDRAPANVIEQSACNAQMTRVLTREVFKKP